MSTEVHLRCKSQDQDYNQIRMDVRMVELLVKNARIKQVKNIVEYRFSKTGTQRVTGRKNGDIVVAVNGTKAQVSALKKQLRKRAKASVSVA